MFKKSKRKIVASIMSVLVLLWAGTIGVIYASSYFEMSKQNRGMLSELAEQYSLSGRPDTPPPLLPEPDWKGPHYSDMMFQLSTFYIVAATYDGTVIEIDNPQQSVHSDAELENMARDILSSGKTTGVKKKSGVLRSR